MSDSVAYDVTEGVGTITLNRPEAMNSLDSATKSALRDTVAEAAGDDSVRVIVLGGSGRAFCVGQDLKEHAASLEAGNGLSNTVQEHYNPLLRTLAAAPKPVIAAVNGVAAGAGAALAFAADLRIASDKAAFNLAFANIGLTADSGASWTLPRLVGPAKALELLMLPDTIGIEQAAALGLVHRVVPAAELDAAVGELAARMAAGPTAAYAAIKRSVGFGLAHTLEETLELEAALQDACAATEDHRNAVRAFLAKEKPTFVGR
ncbi:MAG: enoyl-CoA hydratase [Catenulispora sp.]|nr:enoyl-CoA hydratase [Catenulispora sp.]